MPDYGLSAPQLTVICALSSGATMTAAAEQAGVHRNTISNWRRNLPPFQRALAEAQYDRALLFREEAEKLAALAFQAIRDLLANPQAPAGVRLRAALSILQTVSTPPAPLKQVEFDLQYASLSHNDAQCVPAQTGTPVDLDSVNDTAQSSPEVPADLPPGVPENLNNHAQSTRQTAVNQRQTVPHNLHNPAPNRKIGRNDPCPCGSGQKYKRCCLDKPLTSTSQNADGAAARFPAASRTAR